MATRPQTTTQLSDQRSMVTQWTGLATGDDGTPVPFGYVAERSVQMIGDFGGGTVSLEGSLVLNPTLDSHWRTLTDPQGNPISATSDKLETVMENTVWVRPKFSGGAAGAVDVLLFSRFK